MFTGIVECLGTVVKVEHDKTNLVFTIASPISNQLKINQSVAHDGICLTVIEQINNTHKVVAIAETVSKTNIANWQTNNPVNLERCMAATGRFDGHIVQGHVDGIGACTGVEDLNGSWKYTFTYAANPQHITVEKGSITINGTSLTVVDSGNNHFSVCIIPYTYTHTNFSHIKVGTVVNLEFDIVGKYVARLLQHR